VPFLYSRYARVGKPGFLRPLGYGTLFFLVGLIVFSPWMIRNYNWKNNPVYPLYNTWFNPPASKMPFKVVSPKGTPGKVTRKGGPGFFDRRSLLYHETWWQIAALPIRIFFQGEDGKPQYFDGKLNPFLLFLPIFAFFRKKDELQVIRNEKKIMLTFVVLFFGFAFFSSVLRIRYISPIIPPLVILSVFGAKNVIDLTRGFNERIARQAGCVVVFLALTFALALNARYVVHQFGHVDPLSYLNGALSRDDYITKYRFEYPAMQYVNNTLPANALILFLFIGKRGYYCDRKYIPDTVGQLKRLYRLVELSDDSGKVWLGLRKKGITHLMIQMGFFSRWANDSFVLEKRQVLQDFFKNHLRRLYSRNGVEVFSLQEPAL
jgi:hypothetical protein